MYICISSLEMCLFKSFDSSFINGCAELSGGLRCSCQGQSGKNGNWISSSCSLNGEVGKGEMVF